MMLRDCYFNIFKAGGDNVYHAKTVIFMTCFSLPQRCLSTFRRNILPASLALKSNLEIEKAYSSICFKQFAKVHGLILRRSQSQY